MGQDHPMNGRVELDLEQFVELLARTVPPKRGQGRLALVVGGLLGGGGGAGALPPVSVWAQFGEWLTETFFPAASKSWFGKWRE